VLTLPFAVWIIEYNIITTLYYVLRLELSPINKKIIIICPECIQILSEKSSVPTPFMSY